MGWKSIVEGLKVIQSYCGILVGDGRSVRILDDRWVNGEKVEFMNEAMNIDPKKPVWVAHLIVDGKWNGTALIKWFKAADAGRILMIHVPKIPLQGQDLLERALTRILLN